MYPILIEIGGIKVYTYGFFIAIAFILSAEYCARVSDEIGVKGYKTLDAIFWILIAGIIGTRIAYIIMNIDDYIKEPIKILKIWEGGLAWYGGIIAGILAVYLWTRKNQENFLRTLDLVSLAVILGLSIGRWGCFSAGCCYGKPTDFATGVVFKHPQTLAMQGIQLHPTQIYEALGMFLTFTLTRGIMVGWKQNKTKKSKNIFELKTDIFLLIELILVRFYYLWYSKNVSFPNIIDIFLIPTFVGVFYLTKYIGIKIGGSMKYFEGIIGAIYLVSYGALRFFLEFMRDPSGLSGFIIDKTITSNHIISVLISLAGIHILVKRKFPFIKNQ